MLKHYVVLALRNARRAPLVAAVNVLTLALGITCFLIVYAFVSFWQGAERHFAKSDRIGVLTMSMRLGENGFGFDDDIVTPEIVGRYLKADFPAIESFARAAPISDKATVSSGDRATRLAAFAVDPEFLDLFDLPFVAGDANRALAEPRSVVLTKTAAAQLFGDADPMGRGVLVESVVETTVTGVIDAIPEPSHMGRSKTAAVRFDLLASRDVIETIRQRVADPSSSPDQENWVQGTATTYVLLPADGSLSIASLRDGLADFVGRHVPKETQQFVRLRYGLVPVREILAKSVDSELFLTDIGTSVTSMLLLLAGLVLVVACVNYVNLATARAAARLREVGLRKALGARPAQVMLQHVGEAALAAIAAALLSVAGFWAIAPSITELFGADLRTTFVSPGTWSALAALVAAVTLVGGAYPAFALSRIEPAHAIRSSRGVVGPRRLSTLLVGSQFAVASFLLIAVTITAMQNAALRRTGLNAASDPLVVIDNTSRAATIDRETFRTELQRHSAIKGYTEVGGLPWASLSATAVKESPGDTAVARTVISHSVGFDFFATFNIDLIAGRVFGREYGDETSPARGPLADGRPIVVDRAFAEKFGFESPQAAVDKIVYFPNDTSDTPARIVGVVEDKIMVFFNIGDMRASIYTLRGDLPYEIVRVSKEDVPGGLERIDAVWKQLAPNVAIERTFIDDVFNRVYETYAQISQVFSGLAAIAFLISVTGLFGTATLVAGRRMREIGVRKTHGASTGRILAMLLGHFMRPIVIASVVVWPLAFFAARAYLDTFRDPIGLGAVPFVLSLVVTCAIAWLAVGVQAIRAARMRPADVLRYE